MLSVRQERVHQVRDNEAYSERLAIVEESGDVGLMEGIRIANEAGVRTRYSIVASEAFRGSWVPLMTWCVEISQRFGAEDAVSIWFEIQERVKAEREWWEMLRSR